MNFELECQLFCRASGLSASYFLFHLETLEVRPIEFQVDQILTQCLKAFNKRNKAQTAQYRVKTQLIEL